jgi:hypothetical protein
MIIADHAITAIPVRLAEISVSRFFQLSFPGFSAPIPDGAKSRMTWSLGSGKVE